MKKMLTAAQQEAKSAKADHDSRVAELKTMNTAVVNHKNQLANLSKQSNALKVRVEEGDKLKQENAATIKQLK